SVAGSFGLMPRSKQICPNLTATACLNINHHLKYILIYFPCPRNSDVEEAAVNKAKKLAIIGFILLLLRCRLALCFFWSRFFAP
ncbi:MAG: hypothetical protein II124_01315, partial [Clostridia bacterium]|nr:hypothetical protein [Clostridia bacterium]